MAMLSLKRLLEGGLKSEQEWEGIQKHVWDDHHEAGNEGSKVGGERGRKLQVALVLFVTSAAVAAIFVPHLQVHSCISLAFALRFRRNVRCIFPWSAAPCSCACRLHGSCMSPA
jgi:hypothetical protein